MVDKHECIFFSGQTYRIEDSQSLDSSPFGSHGWWWCALQPPPQMQTVESASIEQEGREKEREYERSERGIREDPPRAREECVKIFLRKPKTETRAMAGPLSSSSSRGIPTTLSVTSEIAAVLTSLFSCSLSFSIFIANYSYPSNPTNMA